MAEYWYSTKELAGLPGIYGDSDGVLKQAKKNLWLHRSKERGKGQEYAESSLPEATRAYFHAQRQKAALADLDARIGAGAALPGTLNLPAVVKKQALAVKGPAARPAFNDLDNARIDAAMLLIRAVEGVCHARQMTVSAACEEFAQRLCAGDAYPELIAAAQTLYIKPRADAGFLGGVSAQQRRLVLLMTKYAKGRRAGDVALYIAPARQPQHQPSTLITALFLRHFCHPSRPTVRDAYAALSAELRQAGLDAPSYSTVNRIEKRLPVIVKCRGRVTGSEMKGLLPYIDRDDSLLRSNDVWVGDGHSFKAKVQHPQHGQPFVPEVTIIMDWKSRRTVGWSIDLAESTLAVSAAFRHAQINTRARPLVYYSDNGSGQTGKLIDHEITGTLARQGIGHHTGIPGNPQGRGIIERSWQSHLIKLARSYPTCTWGGADEGHVNKMLKLLNRKDGGGVAVPSFKQFVEDIARCIHDYNHTHIKRKTGHCPEDDYLDALDKDAIVFGPSDAEIAALWMPETIRKVQRGLVTLHNERYFNPSLVGILPENTKVRVRFDIHNVETVWLYTLDGTYIADARWNGNSRAVFPQNYLEKQRETRAQGRTRRGEKLIKDAQAELGNTYEQSAMVVMDVPQFDAMLIPAEHIDPDEKIMSFEDMQKKFNPVPEEGDDDANDRDFKAASGQ